VGTAGVSAGPGGFEAIVFVRTGPSMSPTEFVRWVMRDSTVIQVWRVAADIDVVVRLSCPSLAALEAVVARMRHDGGAEHTVTHLVLPADPTVDADLLARGGDG
jgi:hypothetical protein